MKKTLPYILIIAALLIAGGWYIHTIRPNSNLLEVKFNSQSSENNDTQNPSLNNQPKFNNQGPAPELVGITQWLNSEPLTLAQLQGQVVLVDFWTYSCINCIRTFPYVTDWYQKYKDQGLVVIGVHTPEFAFERITSNVETAIKRYGITYPVAQDNNYKTWTAFNNRFWPAHYLIDRNGNLVYTHFGEGKYEQTELAIRTLLGLEGEFQSPPPPANNQAQTAEIYLGTARLGKSFGGSEKPGTDEQIFVFPKRIANNKFALEGKWQFSEEAAIHTQGFGRLRINFNAANVYMVAQAQQPTTVKVYVDGQLVKGLVLNESNLYTLFESDAGQARTLELEIPQGGVQIFTFTFS